MLDFCVGSVVRFVVCGFLVGTKVGFALSIVGLLVGLVLCGFLIGTIVGFLLDIFEGRIVGFAV